MSKKAEGIVSCMSRSDARRLRERKIPFYSALVGKCPVLGSSALEVHGHTNTAKSQEDDDLKHFPYEERLERVGTVQPGEQRSVEGSFHCTLVKGGQKWNRIRLFSVPDLNQYCPGSESVVIN